MAKILNPGATGEVASFQFLDAAGNPVAPDPTWVITFVSSDPGVVSCGAAGVANFTSVQSVLTVGQSGSTTISVSVVDASGNEVAAAAGGTLSAEIGTVDIQIATLIASASVLSVTP